MKQWQQQLLNPAIASDVRATAVREHLSLDSPWRKAVLRHDTRMWSLFPEECAMFGAESEDHLECKSEVDGTLQQPVSIPELQGLAADLATQVASYVRASSSTCTGVAALESAVQALVQVRSMLRRFDDAVAKHEQAAKRALESAREQLVGSG